MADNNNNTTSTTSDAAAAAAPVSQSAAAPVQPAATHQPAAYGQQTVGYAQYPNAYGQQYQNYQQYGYQNGGYYTTPYTQSAYPQAVPAAQPAESKFRVNMKMVLHGSSIVFSIITLGLGLSLISAGTEISFLAAVACPVPVMALIWSAAELIVRAVHKFQRGIHPGGSVAATLILWLAAAIVGALEAIFSVTTDGYCDYDYDPDTYVYRETNCYNPWNGRWGVWIAVTAFTCLLWLIYFTLFVIACIDTSRRNAAKRMVMVVNPASYWGPQAQAWQQIPQQNGQYMTAPQPVAGANTDIPLQQREPSPATPYATPMETTEKGKEPEQPAHGVQEFYGGGR